MGRKKKKSTIKLVCYMCGAVKHADRVVFETKGYAICENAECYAIISSGGLKKFKLKEAQSKKI